MAINFPLSPSLNDTYTYNSKTWKWNGTAWEKSAATETGNTEGNTGEVAYYDSGGSVIKGATAFLYDDSTGKVHFYQGISAEAGATFGGDVNFLGNAIVATGGFLQWPDGTTQSTRENITFELDGDPLAPTDEPHRTLDLVVAASDEIVISSTATLADTARYVFSLGANVPKKDESNVFTHSSGNIFNTPIGSTRYTWSQGTVGPLLASIDHASTTYMGITGGLINFKILGTDILDMDSDIHAFVGISADAGATFDGAVTATSFVGALTGNVTGNASGTSATVTTAAQGNITSVGTLTALTMGGELSCVDNLVTRPKLKDYGETVNVIGTITGDTTVDIEAGNVQTVTVSNASTEFDFENWSATGIASTLTLIITNGGSQTVTWVSAVYWPGNNAPSLTSSGVDIVSFMTTNAGTTIYGFVGGIAFA